jgi:hypothetical protein
VEKLSEKYKLGRMRRIWEDNIKMDISGIRGKELTQDRGDSGVRNRRVMLVKFQSIIVISSLKQRVRSS